MWMDQRPSVCLIQHRFSTPFALNTVDFTPPPGPVLSTPQVQVCGRAERQCFGTVSVGRPALRVGRELLGARGRNSREKTCLMGSHGTI